ncbi:MAG: hypothetical protein NC200_06275 [Candidatus Gastranaerophilales bacterium]|nr:hypothetical protein [Candidatus Gastranaerophilales bacterium]
MKKVLSILLLVAFINIALPVNAAVHVNAGHKIPIIYNGEKVTGKNTTSGDRVFAEIKTDVKINGVVVFKQGNLVTLNISDAKKARCWGIPGELHLINGTAVDSKGITRPIEYNYKITGEEKTWPKALGAVSIFFLFPLALAGFVHGGQAELNSGKTINATLVSDFNF